MRPNRLRQLLRAGTPSLGTRLVIDWPGLVEIIGQTHLFDYVEFVAEDAPYDLHTLEHFGRAVDLFDHLSSMIKVDWYGRQAVASRAVGSGIQNVLFTYIRTAEDAASCIEAVRPSTPQGAGRFGSTDRRFSGYVVDGGTPQYVQALEDVVIAFMIENSAAVANLDAILATPGVDMIVFGASDYSMSIGKPNQMDLPEVVKVRDDVYRTALAAGVQPRAEVMEPDQARRYLDLGIRHFSIGIDAYILNQWWCRNGDEMRKVMEGG